MSDTDCYEERAAREAAKKWLGETHIDERAPIVFVEDGAMVPAWVFVAAADIADELAAIEGDERRLNRE